MTAAKGLEGITIENSEICKINGATSRLILRDCCMLAPLLQY